MNLEDELKALIREKLEDERPYSKIYEEDVNYYLSEFVCNLFKLVEDSKKGEE